MHKLQIILLAVYILWGQFSPQNKISYLWHIPLSSGGRPAGVDVLFIIVVRVVLEQINKSLLLNPAIPHLFTLLETYYSMFYSEQAEHSSKLLFRHLTNKTRTKNRPIDKIITRITNVVNPSICHG